MPAVTVNKLRNNVNGNYRQKLYNVDIANNGDTLVTPLSYIAEWNATAQSAAAVGGTVSGGTITFATSGALPGVVVQVMGW